MFGLARFKNEANTYLLLTEFEGRTVSYGPSLSKGKKRESVTYSTDRENEISKIFIISLVCVWGAQERFLFTRNGFKFLKEKQFDLKSFLSRQHALIHNLE